MSPPWHPMHYRFELFKPEAHQVDTVVARRADWISLMRSQQIADRDVVLSVGETLTDLVGDWLRSDLSSWQQAQSIIMPRKTMPSMYFAKRATSSQFCAQCSP